MALRSLGIMLDGIGEVLDSKFMISHVLINNTSRNINCFVVVYFLDDFPKTFESFLELINSMVHQPEVKSTADEIFLQ